MTNQIEIRIDAKNLTPERFIKAAQAFLSLVQGVAANLTGDKNAIKWTVEVAGADVGAESNSFTM